MFQDVILQWRQHNVDVRVQFGRLVPAVQHRFAREQWAGSCAGIRSHDGFLTVGRCHVFDVNHFDFFELRFFFEKIWNHWDSIDFEKRLFLFLNAEKLWTHFVMIVCGNVIQCCCCCWCVRIKWLQITDLIVPCHLTFKQMKCFSNLIFLFLSQFGPG